MADYTIIAKTGASIVKKLRSELVPELLKNENEICLCEPYEKCDCKVRVCLYDIAENTDISTGGISAAGISGGRYPSIFLNLYYMITVSSQSDLKFRADEEARILGRILQIFHDEGMKKSASLPQNGELPLKIELLRLTHEEKTKIWAYHGTPYKLSLFYRIVPVEIESLIEERISRVKEAEFTFEERKRTDERSF